MKKDRTNIIELFETKCFTRNEWMKKPYKIFCHFLRDSITQLRFYLLPPFQELLILTDEKTFNTQLLTFAEVSIKMLHEKKMLQVSSYTYTIDLLHFEFDAYRVCVYFCIEKTIWVGDSTLPTTHEGDFIRWS